MFKPPLGVMSAYLWRRNRIHELIRALKDGADVDWFRPILVQWSEELTKLLKEECHNT